MWLVWFPKLGSRLQGSQAGSPCQAISTHRSPRAQRSLKGVKSGPACSRDRGQSSWEPAFTESPGAPELEGDHTSPKLSFPLSSKLVSPSVQGTRQPPRPCSGLDSLFPLVMAKPCFPLTHSITTALQKLIWMPASRLLSLLLFLQYTPNAHFSWCPVLSCNHHSPISLPDGAWEHPSFCLSSSFPILFTLTMLGSQKKRRVSLLLVEKLAMTE